MSKTIKKDGLTIECDLEVHYDGAIALIQRYKGPLTTVVDIGACIGGLSLHAAKRGAKNVYAYEPNEVSFATLQSNIKRNQFTSVIHAEQKAVIGSAVKLESPVLSTICSGQASLIYDKNRNNVFENATDTIQFQQILSTVGYIDYLKIDIEGGEYLMVDDIFLDFLTRHVNFLDFELHAMVDSYFQTDTDLIPERYRPKEAAASHLLEALSQCGLQVCYGRGNIHNNANVGFAKNPEQFDSFWQGIA